MRTKVAMRNGNGNGKGAKQRQWPTITEGITGGGAVFYLVDTGRRITPRIRKRFVALDGRGGAQAYADELRSKLVKEGTSAFTLRPAETEAARKALRILAGLDVTLDQAARFFRDHHAPAGGERTVKQVVDELIEYKIERARRKRYIMDLDSRLGRFASTFGRRKIAEVTAEQIRQWLYGDSTITERTRHNNFRALNVLFNFAAGKRAGGFTAKPYRADNPLASIDRPEFEAEPPRILTVKQAEKLLEVAAGVDGLGLLPYAVLGLFCGVRTTELMQLYWADVNFEDWRVTIGARIAKKRKIRNVEIPENARLWLAPYEGRTGKIAPPNAIKRLTHKVAPEAGLAKWPTNCMRHSFGSYFYAMTEDAGKTAARLGHPGDEQLFAHYRALVTKKQGEAYFDLKPPADEGGKVVQFEGEEAGNA